MNCRRGRRDQHHESKNGSGAEKHHESPALSSLISKVTSRDGSDASSDVRGDAHELSLVIGIPHVLDDGGEEEGDRVQRGIDTYATVSASERRAKKRNEPMVMSMWT